MVGCGELVQQGNQLEKRLGIEPLWRETERVVQGRIGPVGPFARDAEGAALQLAQDERVDATCAPLFEYFEVLASKRVEGVTNLRPSQMHAGLKCSSR